MRVPGILGRGADSGVFTQVLKPPPSFPFLHPRACLKQWFPWKQSPVTPSAAAGTRPSHTLLLSFSQSVRSNSQIRRERVAWSCQPTELGGLLPQWEAAQACGRLDFQDRLGPGRRCRELCLQLWVTG